MQRGMLTVMLLLALGLAACGGEKDAETPAAEGSVTAAADPAADLTAKLDRVDAILDELKTALGQPGRPLDVMNTAFKDLDALAATFGADEALNAKFDEACGLVDEVEDAIKTAALDPKIKGDLDHRSFYQDAALISLELVFGTSPSRQQIPQELK